jgi:hypothetical protein
MCRSKGGDSSKTYNNCCGAVLADERDMGLIIDVGLCNHSALKSAKYCRTRQFEPASRSRYSSRTSGSQNMREIKTRMLLLYLVLAMFFAMLVLTSISALLPCWFPEPIRPGQMDGITCDWPFPWQSNVLNLVLGCVGSVGVFGAWRGSRLASLLLSLVALVIASLMIWECVQAYNAFGSGVTVFGAIGIGCCFAISTVMYLCSNSSRGSEAKGKIT